MTDNPNRFRPGQSGNPRGRPRIAQELREPVREMTPELLERLRTIALKEKARDATPAIKLLLAYAWGEPRQAPEVKEDLVVDAGPSDAVTFEPKVLTTEQLEAVRRIIRPPPPALVEVTDAEVVEAPQNAPATALPASPVHEEAEEP